MYACLSWDGENLDGSTYTTCEQKQRAESANTRVLIQEGAACSRRERTAKISVRKLKLRGAGVTKAQDVQAVSLVRLRKEGKPMERNKRVQEGAVKNQDVEVQTLYHDVEREP